jgi:phage portal protein BeeE
VVLATHTFGQPRRVDTNELRQFSQTFWVAACVKTLVDEISTLEWDILPKDDVDYGSVQEKAKEIKDFLKYPNKNRESFNTIMRALLKDLLELDAGTLVKVFDIDSYDFTQLEPKSGSPLLKPLGQRRLTEIYARDGASFLKETDKFGYVNGYWQYSYQIPAHPMWFNRDEICYIMENPRSMSTYGFARTQAVLDIVKSLHYSTLYNKKFFEESAMPDGALGLKDTNEAEMKAFRDSWEREFRAQPHKFVVINKEIDWKPFSLSNKEMQFLESQNAYIKWIITMFGLTPSELGITDDVNRATSATQSEVTKRRGVRPFLKLIESYINSDIIPEFNTEDVIFQFIYDDPAEKTQRLNNWKLEIEMGIKTPNEVRREMGMEPIEGGDERIQTELDAGTPNDGRVGNKENKRNDREGQGEHDRQENAGKDSRHRQDQAEGKHRDNVKTPYSGNKRPVTKTISMERIQSVSEANGFEIDQVRQGLSVEMEHIKTVGGNEDIVLNIVLDHLREDKDYYTRLAEIEKEHDIGKPFAGYRDFKACVIANRDKKDPKAYCAEIMHRSEKGYVAPVGAYYNDQPIAHNKVKFDPVMFGMYPDKLTNDQRRPEINPERYSSPQEQYLDPDLKTIKCPVCGFNTLNQATSADDIGKDVKLRCINCGAEFFRQELMDQSVANHLENTMQSNNRSAPTDYATSPLVPK